MARNMTFSIPYRSHSILNYFRKQSIIILIKAQFLAVHLAKHPREEERVEKDAERCRHVREVLEIA